MSLPASEISVAATEDLAALGPSTLAAFDVLMFALTSGELPFSADQKTAIVDFVSGGGGFVGVHSASDTLYEWPEYGRLVGAYFKEHPWTQQASLIVEDGSHPATAGLGERFSMLEEFYTFRENPRPRVQVLLRLDAAVGGIDRRLSDRVGAVVRQRTRLLQCARTLPGDLARPAVPAADRRRDPLGGEALESMNWQRSCRLRRRGRR